MILQALTQYYEDLLHRGEIAAPGWSPAKISFALCLDKDGQVTQIINIQQPSENGKAQMPQTIRNLPAPVKRTVGIASNFLWDNSTYLLGVDQKGKPKRSQEGLLSRCRKSAPYRIGWRGFAHCQGNSDVLRYLAAG